MKRSKALIGMPVICGGKKLGRITQVGLSDDLNRMDGVWIDCGFKGTRFIGSDNIDMLGEVAVFSKGEGKRAQCDGQTVMRRALTPDGARAGAITDALIDEESMDIRALELSEDYLNDLAFGRKHIRQYHVVGDGNVIIERIDTRSEGGDMT